MTDVTNISAYKFASLTDLKPLRESLIARCGGWKLKGTILLSKEGINLFVAGSRREIDLLVEMLRAIPGLEELNPKFSVSGDQPFTRMLVRIKKEIISFGVDGIDPARAPSPKLSALTLKQWLDEGRPLTLLDTRNDYEVKLGTFKGAHVLGIDHFRQLPAAVDKLPAEMKEQPIVMFCTGGIRCEKAGPFMEGRGFQNIFQLDGGILKYFEECGGEHYDGECFVFDQRVGVDPGLRETESSQCFVCQTPLDAADQKDSRYVAGVSCPYCHQATAERSAENLAQRNEAFRLVARQLSGEEMLERRRPINIPPDHDGRPLLDFLSQIFAHVPREEWKARCEQGQIVDVMDRPLSASDRIRAGERCFLRLPAAPEPAVNAEVRVLYEDEAILVLNKPAPLPMHPCGRFHRNTLQFLLRAVYEQQNPRPAHRLDANTTGLVLCARTRHFARLVQPQFEKGTVTKVYLARVHGHPPKDHFIEESSISNEPGGVGKRSIVEQGLPARTEFRVLHRHDSGDSLIEVRPLTGRTNQIRLHLSHLGFPICGDSIYRNDGRQDEVMTLSLDAPPLQLHAWKLTFRHPVTGENISFEAERPAWVKSVEPSDRLTQTFES